MTFGPAAGLADASASSGIVSSHEQMTIFPVESGISDGLPRGRGSGLSGALLAGAVRRL